MMAAVFFGSHDALRQIADMAAARSRVNMPDGCSLEVFARCAQRHAESEHDLQTELAEALRELLACSMPTGEDTRTDRAMAKASAALAKVEGAA